jgi:hypothetical protein
MNNKKLTNAQTSKLKPSPIELLASWRSDSRKEKIWNIGD